MLLSNPHSVLWTIVEIAIWIRLQGQTNLESHVMQECTNTCGQTVLKKP